MLRLRRWTRRSPAAAGRQVQRRYFVLYERAAALGGSISAMNTAERLPAAVLFSYALPGAGTGFLFVLMLVVYLNYATEVLGVSASVVGAVFFAARVWDAVCDPLAGYWSDRTRSRLGRRKSWLLACVSRAARVRGGRVGAAARARARSALTAWIAVAVFGFYTAYTLFEVPHMALGAELTQERRDRVRVFAARQFVRTLGLFAAFGLGAALLEDLATARERLALLAGIAGVLTVASILWAIAALPRERPDYAGRGPAARGARRATCGAIATRGSCSSCTGSNSSAWAGSACWFRSSCATCCASPI